MLLLANESTDAKAAARRLLQAALVERYGLTHLPNLACGPFGKPYFSEYPHIHFNLSHSGPLALCAVGDNPVGVDIEWVRPRSPGLISGVLTPEEYRWYRENGSDWPAFYTLWTRKESLCKYRGTSVLHPKRICLPLPGETDEGIIITNFSGEEWRVAVCAQETPEPIQWREF